MAVAAQERMLDRLIERFAADLNMESLSDEQFFELIMDLEKKYHFHGA
jgi:dipeptidase